MHTFLDLQQRVLDWIDEGDDASVTRDKVKAALNASHQRLLGSRTWPFSVWPREEEFSTTAGIRTYGLKHGVSKVLTLYSASDGVPCPLISRREWESLGVDRVGTRAIPMGAIYGDVWPVSSQPTTAAVCVVTSTTDADATAGNTVIVQGLDSNGDRASETLTLLDVGSTSAVTGTTSFSLITAVTKTGTWTGTMTLTIGGTTRLTLTASQYGKQYPTLEFIETPSESRDYLYTAQRTPTILTNDYDIPDTPFPYSEFHVYDVLLDWTTYNTELGAKEQRLFSQRRQELLDGLSQAYDEGIAGAHPRYVRNMNPRPQSLIRLN